MISRLVALMETPVPQRLLWLNADVLIDSVISVFHECVVWDIPCEDRLFFYICLFFFFLLFLFVGSGRKDVAIGK